MTTLPGKIHANKNMANAREFCSPKPFFEVEIPKKAVFGRYELK